MSMEDVEKCGNAVLYPQGFSFSDLLNWHLNFGTRPTGHLNQPGKRWTNREFAAEARVSADEESGDRVVRNWRAGRNRPNDLECIERTLFGKNAGYLPWRVDLREAYDRLNRTLQIAGVEFIRNMGWSDLEFIKRIIDLDYQITDGLDEDNEATPEEMAKAFVNFPDTWRVVVQPPDTIVGYWHFTPLLREHHESAKKGILTDNALIPANMRQLGLPGTYDIYIAFLGALPGHTRSGLRALCLSFLDVVRLLSRDDIYIGSICANGFTTSGAQLCADIGLAEVCKHKKSGAMFENSLVNVLRHVASSNPLLLRAHLDVKQRYEKLNET